MEELTSEDKPKYSAWAAKHVPDAAKPDAEKAIPSPFLALNPFLSSSAKDCVLVTVS